MDSLETALDEPWEPRERIRPWKHGLANHHVLAVDVEGFLRVKLEGREGAVGVYVVRSQP